MNEEREKNITISTGKEVKLLIIKDTFYRHLYQSTLLVKILFFVLLHQYVTPQYKGENKKKR